VTRSWTPAEVLPHRPPLLLLTRICSWHEDGLVAEVDVDPTSPFAESGLGVPRWVGLEYMAQAVGALDGVRLRTSGLPVSPGYLLGTRTLDQVDGYFRDGTTLRISVQEVLQGDNGLGIFSCRLDDGERFLCCQLTVYRPPVGGPESDAQ
jgi:predicted hotdog family 3-hydroxylacyl-ACP dehydratase